MGLVRSYIRRFTPLTRRVDRIAAGVALVGLVVAASIVAVRSCAADSPPTRPATRATIAGTRSSGTARSAATTTPPTALPTGLPLPTVPAGGRVCEPGRTAPPGPGIEWQAVGQTGNEWALIAEPGRSLVVRGKIVVDGAAAGIDLVLAPDDGPYPTPDSRHLASATGWGPGAHEITLQWDGTDDSGAALAPGRYRLFAESSIPYSRSVTCLDGSGAGYEFVDGGGGAGLGVMIVP